MAQRSSGSYSHMKNPRHGIGAFGLQRATADEHVISTEHQVIDSSEPRHHCRRLGKGERPEHASFLCFEQEHGDERDDDDRERKEDGRADLTRRSQIARG
jgi:hypothetical protein